jgi:hypothetical protein
VLPEVHDGLLTRHDFLLPGPASLQRGAESLDPVPPVVAGREIRDDPLASTAPTAPRSYHRNRRRQVR